MSDRRWTIRELLLKSQEFLREKQIENPRLNAELLLSKVLGLNRLGLYLDLDRPLTNLELSEYRELIKRRIQREPLQYILGTACFYNLELKVGKGVLIPRHETELLVDTVLQEVKANRFSEEPVWCLDIGTGTGCIALSILKETNNTRFLATDISDTALQFAEENARREDLIDRIEFRRGDLFEAIREGERFHIIVSNPPYVAEDEWDTLQPEVKDHEPKEALLGGKDGLSVIRRLIKGSRAYLREKGILLLEIAPHQAREVARLMKESGFLEIRVLKDLSSRERAILGSLAPSKG